MADLPFRDFGFLRFYHNHKSERRSIRFKLRGKVRLIVSTCVGTDGEVMAYINTMTTPLTVRLTVRRL